METKEIIWHSLTVAEAFKELKTKTLGLTEEQAGLRRQKFGFNELPKKSRQTKLKIFLTQFNSVLVYILLFAALISFFLGEHIDVYVILAAVIVNVSVGFVQENKAQTALHKLSQLAAPKVRVIRNGRELIMPARQLVPGDIINIQAGDILAADARLFEAVELEISEAPLTGESIPVQKQFQPLEKGRALAERAIMVYSGTSVIRGKGRAMVTATGLKSQIGQIAGLLSQVEEEITPLQKKLDIFSKNLGIFILILSALLLVVGTLTGRGFLVMFNTSVAVAVAAIPEGLLVAVTVILALGMQSILKKQALVRRLVAAETLGSTTVICTDKTGTLTLGEMRVTEIVTESHELELSKNSAADNLLGLSEIFWLLKIGILCNDAIIQNDTLNESRVLGSATESALLLAGLQVGLKQSHLSAEYPRLSELTFSSERKFMATLNGGPAGRKLILIKGAPEKIMAVSAFIQTGDRPIKIYKDKREEINNKFIKLSRKGLRVLALAYKFVDQDTRSLSADADFLNDFIWVGLVGIKDPLRPLVKETLIKTTRAGIKTVIITGDNKITAKTIALELGLPADDKHIMEGADLLKLDDETLQAKVAEIKIYARVTPADKLRIVEAWQKRGEVVAMTGDGVNDAPALKRADVGIALGSGSDVAKSAADLILLNNGFSTIVAAVEQGRVIYDNIKKVILYLLSDSFSEVILIFLSIILGWPLPLLATQILWINLVTDGFPSMALTLEPEENEIMNESPQARRKPILYFERRLF